MHRNLAAAAAAAAAVVILLSVLFFLALSFRLHFCLYSTAENFENRQNHKQCARGMAWSEAKRIAFCLNFFCSHIYFALGCVRCALCVVRVSHIYFSENNFMLHDIGAVRFPSSHNFYLFLNDSTVAAAAAAATTTPVVTAAGAAGGAVWLSFKIFMVMRWTKKTHYKRRTLLPPSSLPPHQNILHKWQSNKFSMTAQPKTATTAVVIKLNKTKQK